MSFRSRHPCFPLVRRRGFRPVSLSDREGGLMGYANKILSQQNILIEDDHGSIAGLLGFMVTDSSDETWPKNTTYITLVAITPSNRGLGLSHMLYEFLDSICSTDTITVRTWSANKAQTSILPKHGYEEWKRIPHDRPDGSDTIYYRKRISN